MGICYCCGVEVKEKKDSCIPHYFKICNEFIELQNEVNSKRKSFVYKGYRIEGVTAANPRSDIWLAPFDN